ncbi:hypothetical protein HanIR_Chr02g0093091 [Helianthus annuus]|nr:hypothetical protein HanIR_Chr02g0093091 [Helianthus annuus]
MLILICLIPISKSLIRFNHLIRSFHNTFHKNKLHTKINRKCKNKKPDRILNHQDLTVFLQDL